MQLSEHCSGSNYKRVQKIINCAEILGISDIDRKCIWSIFNKKKNTFA